MERHLVFSNPFIPATLTADDEDLRTPRTSEVTTASESDEPARISISAYGAIALPAEV